MKYLDFNNKQLSKLVFGGASISGEGKGYGFGDISESDSINLLLHAYDSGINFFDTAPIYGFGTSEVRMGKAFKDIREKVFICSKGGVDWHSSMRVNMSNDPVVIQRMFDESRRRLDSDYIDLYMIHWPDPKIDIRYSLEPLYQMKEKGYIRSIGLCNTNQEDLDLVESIDFVQSEFNYFNDGFRSLDFNALKMGWGTFDKGILSSSVKIDTKFSQYDCRSWAPWWKKSNWKEKVRLAESLQKKIHPTTLKEFSFKHSLDSIDFSIVGMKSHKHVDDLIGIL